MHTLTTQSIPDYRLDEATGRGYAVFGDRSIEFGPYDDPRSRSAYDRLLSRWLANGRQLPGPNDQTDALSATGPIPFEQFRDEVLSIYEPPLRALATWREAKYALRCIGETGATTTADLSVSMLSAIVINRPPTNSPNRTRTVLRHVSAICAYAEKMGYIRISPFRIRGIGTFARAVPSRRKKHASREEIRRVLEHMAERAKADGWLGWKAKRLHSMTAFLAYTGARAGEIYYLQTTDVDLDKGIIWIVSRAEHRTKTIGSAAPIPMAPDLIPIAREWFRHRMSVPPGFKIDAADCPWVFPTIRRHRRAPWTQGGPGYKPRDQIQAVAAEAGVLGFTPLMLRHSLATHLLHWGASAGTIQRILRHTNTRTQEAYLHSDIPDLQAAVANVRF
jgi:integrase